MKSRNKALGLHWIAHVRRMTRTLQQHQLTLQLLCQLFPSPGVDLSVPWTTSTGQRTCLISSATSVGPMIFVSQPRNPVRIVSMSISIAQLTQSPIGLVECGSVRHIAKKNSTYLGQSRSQQLRVSLAQPSSVSSSASNG